MIKRTYEDFRPCFPHNEGRNLFSTKGRAAVAAGRCRAC